MAGASTLNRIVIGLLSSPFVRQKFPAAARIHAALRLGARQFSKSARLIGTPLVGTGMLWSAAMWKTSDKGAIDDRFYVLARADALYDAYWIDQLSELLTPHKNSSDPEVLWRLARCLYEKAKLMSDTDAARKPTVFEAFQCIERALKCEGGDKLFAVHKWYAILLNQCGNYEGAKERIKNAYVVREHLQRAIDLYSQDSTTWHIMGLWCFTIAEMPWYQMKIASVIFATPPSSSYDEALSDFLKAETLTPGFYSKNLLMIGRTYLALGKRELAKEYLQLTVDYITKTQDDIDAHREAQQLLAKHFADDKDKKAKK